MPLAWPAKRSSNRRHNPRPPSLRQITCGVRMMPWRSASSQFDGIVLKALPSPSSHENSPEGYFRGNVEMIALLVRVLGADQLYLEEDLWYGTTTPVPRDQWLAIEV